MITAIVKIKRHGSIEIRDAIGFSAAAIQASAEDMYCDDDEVACVDVMVLRQC